MNEKNIDKMKRRDFDKLPAVGWNENIGEFDSLIILPLKEIHGSGYRCMDFVAVKNNEAICRLSGCSDVLHINGIGGYGRKLENIGQKIDAIAWSIDCLPKSGLLRLFQNGKLKCGCTLSSFEIIAGEKR